MFDQNDPVGKAVEMGAKLFALLADEILRECGEEKGSVIVQNAVRKYGAMRGKAIRERILSDGREVTFETVEEYSDYPPNNAWDCDSNISENTLVEYTRSCPFAKAFRETGLENAGKLYCQEIDIALNEAIFGDIIFARPRLFSDGPDSPCEMVITKQ